MWEVTFVQDLSTQGTKRNNEVFSEKMQVMDWQKHKNIYFLSNNFSSVFSHSTYKTKLKSEFEWQSLCLSSSKADVTQKEPIYECKCMYTKIRYQYIPIKTLAAEVKYSHTLALHKTDSGK